MQYQSTWCPWLPLKKGLEAFIMSTYGPWVIRGRATGMFNLFRGPGPSAFPLTKAEDLETLGNDDSCSTTEGRRRKEEEWKRKNRKEREECFFSITSCLSWDFDSRHNNALCTWSVCTNQLLNWQKRALVSSRVQLFATPWTVAHQAPLSMGFSR